MSTVCKSTAAAADKLAGIMADALQGDTQAQQLVRFAPASLEMATALLTARETIRTVRGSLPDGGTYAKLVEIMLAEMELALAKAGIDPWAGEKLKARADREWDALPPPFPTGFVGEYRGEGL